MTAKELRAKVVSIFECWVGARRGDDTHHYIIDLYNSYTPLPRKVRMSYTMDWCAATVSAVGIAAELTDIMPVECSCSELIRLYKTLGRWVEIDAYIPQPGDLILYSWMDTGYGDCAKAPNHIGMVQKVKGSTIYVLEGNMGRESRVGIRRVSINGRYIRGYCCPDYEKKAQETEDGMKLYHYVADMPEWAQKAATKAIRSGIIDMDKTGAVNVWETNLQTLVWMDRTGMLDRRN